MVQEKSPGGNRPIPASVSTLVPVGWIPNWETHWEFVVFVIEVHHTWMLFHQVLSPSLYDSVPCVC